MSDRAGGVSGFRLASDGLDAWQDQLRASANNWGYHALSAEVGELNQAIWSESLISEVMGGLSGETVELQTRSGMDLRGVLVCVWRDLVLMRCGHNWLVPVSQVRCLKTSAPGPRIGPPIKTLGLAVALRRLLDLGGGARVVLAGEAGGGLAAQRRLCWVGHDWVGLRGASKALAVGGSALEICPIEEICGVCFSSLIAAHQIFVDLTRFDSPLASPTDF